MSRELQRNVALWFVFVGAAWYFVWRPTAINAHHPWWSWIFLAVELSGFVWTIAFLFTVRSLSHRITPDASPGMSVDVVVTTYNESIDVVRPTVIAALAITYPHETWLLDDGARHEMRELAEALGCRYLSRSQNVDAKAGNLNHALPHLRGDFIAVFDCDHVAHPRFLDRTLGFFEDERLAFVQTPQEFVNTDSYQHFRASNAQLPPLHEQSLFFHVIQRGRDLSNAAMLCGTCAVIRRRALDEIGGFATGSVTEDMKTSVRLHAAGWRSLFTPEILSAGIAPFDGRDFRRQRLRWAQGAIQVLAQENILGKPGLSAPQRMHYLLHVLNQVEGWRYAAMFFLPAFVLLSGLAPIDAPAFVYAIHFVPYFAAGVWAYEEFGRGYGRYVEGEIYNLARCAISMRATFAFLARSLPFRVTAKQRSGGLDWLGIALPWSVITVTAFASIEAIVAALRGTATMPMGSLLIAVGWAMFVLYIAGRCVARASTCNRDRRKQPRIALPLRAQARAVSAQVLAVAADGITLSENEFAEGPTRLAMDLGGRTFAPLATLRRYRDGVLGGPLTWGDEDERAEFDAALRVAQIQHFASYLESLTENTTCESYATSLSA